MFTIVKFLNSITTKIVHAGNKRYLTSKLDEKKLVVQVKEKIKHVDDFYLLETNHRNLY